MPYTGSSYQGSREETVQCTSQLGDYAVCKAGRCECEGDCHFLLQDVYCILGVGEKTTLIITIIIIATGTRS